MGKFDEVYTGLINEIWKRERDSSAELTSFVNDDKHLQIYIPYPLNRLLDLDKDSKKEIEKQKEKGNTYWVQTSKFDDKNRNYGDKIKYFKDKESAQKFVDDFKKAHK